MSKKALAMKRPCWNIYLIFYSKNFFFLIVSSCCYGSISSPSQTTKTDNGIGCGGNNTPLSPYRESEVTLSPCRSDITIILQNKRKKLFKLFYFCGDENIIYNKELNKFWKIICPLNWNKFKNVSLAGQFYRIATVYFFIIFKN